MKTVIKALIYDTDNNVLLLNRNITHPNFPSHIDFPGGELEHNETESRAICREIAEETGLSVSVKMVNEVYRKQVSADLIHVVFRVCVKTRKPLILLSWEHTNYKWVPIEEFKKMKLPKSVDEYHLTLLEYLSRRSGR
jgi:8-oxo-dGTP diphosphatase